MPVDEVVSREGLRQVAKQLHVREDWHEPDEQGVTATIEGRRFDNAGVDGERMVVLKQFGKPVAKVNLASLFAMAMRGR